MHKCVFLAMMFIFASATRGIAQYDKTSSKNGKEAVISYKITANAPGLPMMMQDTLFLLDSFVFEPINGIKYNASITLSPKTNISSEDHSSFKRQLTSYYLTSIKQKAGMAFDTNQLHPKITRVYLIEAKNLGYALTSPLFTKGPWTIADFKKEKDTIINNQRCIIVKCDKAVGVKLNNSPDTCVKIHVVINQQLKQHSYSFINEQLSKQFGGAIMSANLIYKSGMNITMQYDYLDRFSKHQRFLFDKYRKLFYENVERLSELRDQI